MVDIEVGFANGRTENPTYKEVCTDKTGFAETVHVTYDSAKVSLKFLFEIYFKAIDPTSINRHDEKIINEVFAEEQKHINGKIAVENQPLRNFYKAEDYHQDYLDKNPDGYCHLPQSLFEFACKARDTKK